jgi:hypothetical protein
MQVVDKVIALLEEMSEQILSNLHDVQKSLCFWQSRAEVFTLINRMQF